MSKITPKNLSYDTSLPPFLQRLKGEFAGSGDGRHERAIARPKRARNAEDEADDEPTYVDEETNHTLSREEYAELVKEGAGEEGAEAVAEGKEGKDESLEKAGEGKDTKEREKIAAVGISRRRKQGRVVGAEEDKNENKDTSIKAAVAKTAALTGGGGKDNKVDGKKFGPEAPLPEKAKEKKKAKKIKLSFNDEEGG